MGLCCSVLVFVAGEFVQELHTLAATHCNTLYYTALHCNTLQLIVLDFVAVC